MKIAIWGVGKHAIKNILPAINNIKELELFGICTRNIEVQNSCKLTYNCKTWDTPEAMLSDKSLDIVYSCSPINLHYDQGLAVLKSGKHFWSEKSFTNSYKKTENLVKYSRDKSLTIAEGFMYLYHPQFKFLQEYIAELERSELRLISSKFTIPLPEDFEDKYLHQKNGLSGSSLLNVGVYPISVVLNLFKNEQPEILSKISKTYKETNFVLNTNISLKFSSGLVCNLMWGMDLSYRNEIDILSSKSSLSTKKIFSKDSQYEPYISLRNTFGDEKIQIVKKDNHFINMFEYFISLIDKPQNAELERKKILKQALFNEEIEHYES